MRDIYNFAESVESKINNRRKQVTKNIELSFKGQTQIQREKCYGEIKVRCTSFMHVFHFCI